MGKSSKLRKWYIDEFLAPINKHEDIHSRNSVIISEFIRMMERNLWRGSDVDIGHIKFDVRTKTKLDYRRKHKGNL